MGLVTHFEHYDTKLSLWLDYLYLFCNQILRNHAQSKHNRQK